MDLDIRKLIEIIHKQPLLDPVNFILAYYCNRTDKDIRGMMWIS